MNVFDFILLKRNVSRHNQVRFNFEKYKRDKSLIVFIHFLYTFLVFQIIFPRYVTFFSITYCKLDTEWLLSILTNFMLLFTAPWWYFRQRYPCLVWHFDLYLKPGMSDFASVDFLRHIVGAWKSILLLAISDKMTYWLTEVGKWKRLRDKTSSSCTVIFTQCASETLLLNIWAQLFKGSLA